jgi:hypothetical protein
MGGVSVLVMIIARPRQARFVAWSQESAGIEVVSHYRIQVLLPRHQVGGRYGFALLNERPPPKPCRWHFLTKQALDPHRRTVGGSRWCPGFSRQVYNKSRGMHSGGRYLAPKGCTPAHAQFTPAIPRRFTPAYGPSSPLNSLGLWYF